MTDKPEKPLSERVGVERVGEYLMIRRRGRFTDLFYADGEYVGTLYADGVLAKTMRDTKAKLADAMLQARKDT